MKSKDVVAQKLCAIVNALEEEAFSSGQMARSRKKRVAAALRELMKIAKKELRPFCNCQQITVVNKAELDEFRAKMAISCPIHGQTRLGIIVTFGGYPSEGDPRDRQLEELVKDYRRRSFCIKKERHNER
jgi:hypothetical protein